MADFQQGALPPGLAGFVAAQQAQGQQQNQQMGLLAQLAQMRSHATQEQEAEQVKQILAQASTPEQAIPLLMKAGQTGVKMAGSLAQLAEQTANQKAAAEKRAFFSPENQGQYMTPARPAIMPDPQENQQAADLGTPPVAAVPAQPGGMDFNRFLQAGAQRGFVNPETYANHLSQREQARASLEASKQARADAIQTRLIEIETRSQDRELDRASRESMAREAQRGRQELAAITRSLRPQRERMVYDSARGGTVNLDTGQFTPAAQNGEPIGNKPTPEKAMPASAVKALMENQTNLRKAELALDLIQGKTSGTAVGNVNATGWRGLLSTTELGDQALQRLDPKGVDTRAAIADLGSMIIHDRSGAAVTAAEYPRLRPFIPKVTDNADTAKKKLERFVTEYRNAQQETVDFFKESGYRVPVNSLRPSPAGGGTNDDPLGIRK